MNADRMISCILLGAFAAWYFVGPGNDKETLPGRLPIAGNPRYESTLDEDATPEKGPVHARDSRQKNHAETARRLRSQSSDFIILSEPPQESMEFERRLAEMKEGKLLSSPYEILSEAPEAN